MHQLDDNDYHVEHNPTGNKHSDIIIVNTCGFIDRAKEESIETILTYAKLKSQGTIGKLFVTGCLSQRYKDKLEDEIPEVDAFFGTMEMPALLHKLNADYKNELVGERVLTTPSHYAYFKISEGCNRTCTFCAIPLMRGKHLSVPMEDLYIQAKKLAAQGVKELILIAQELTYYGLDLYKERKLADLLTLLCQVEGIEWIRLHYAYPSKFPLEVLDVIQKQNKICNYIDIPFQHISDKILKDMKRQITKAETIELIDKIRSKIPGVAIRTTMLVGFPTETEEDFEELCDFIKQTKFDRLGVFQYSHEEDTGAYRLVDQIGQEVKEQRAQKLMSIQEEISQELNDQKIGQVLKVLIDRKEKEYYIGRAFSDSPEVDNEIYIKYSGYLRIGDFVHAKIVETHPFDLYATLIKPDQND